MLADGSEGTEERTIKEVERAANEIIVLMARYMALGVIKGISLNVGSAELAETYSATLFSLKHTNAARLVDLSIKLDHYDAFPQTFIEVLHKDLADKPFAHNVLADLVVVHFTLFRVSYKVRQKIGNLLSFKPSSPEMISDRTKLLKE